METQIITTIHPAPDGVSCSGCCPSYLEETDELNAACGSFPEAAESANGWEGWSRKRVSACLLAEKKLRDLVAAGDRRGTRYLSEATREEAWRKAKLDKLIAEEEEK